MIEKFKGLALVIFGNSFVIKLRTKSVLSFVIAAFVLALTFANANAHEVRPAIFTLDIAKDRTFSLTASLNIEALLAQIGGEHDDTDSSPNKTKYDELRNAPALALEEKLRGFAPQWLSTMGLTFGNVPAAMDVKSMSISDVGDISLSRISEIVLVGNIPSGANNLKWAYPSIYGSAILRINRPSGEAFSQWFSAGTASEEMAIYNQPPRSQWQKFYDYVVVGFTHILPKGLDHILFVLGLFLLSHKWRPLLTQVTAFTLAHSVTLALGIYGIVTISPAIVEPLIALSIVYVAVENILTSRMHFWRPIIVFGFGLLHGLGFAGVLAEIGLPRGDYALGLIAFNVGVELGQLSVIALGFWAVGWFMRADWYRKGIVIPVSIVIAIIGIWWFFERIIA